MNGKVNPSVAITCRYLSKHGIFGREEGSRLDEAKNLLPGTETLFKALSEMFDVRLYTLGES
jgi:hypothetical protein